MARLFSKQDIRGIALLLPLLVVGVWIAVEALSGGGGSAESEAATSAQTEDASAMVEADTLRLHSFDPNTVTYEELRQMGVEKYVARGIVKYREGGRTYAIPEDVAVVYGLSDSLYALLKPHIAIADEFKLKPRTYHNGSSSARSSSARSSSSTRKRAFRNIPFDPNALSAEGFYELGCFTAKQAQALVDYRERNGGFRSLLEFRDCYLIDSVLYAQMEPYITLSEVVANTSSPRDRTFKRVPFDPNTLSAEGFYELGCFTARQAEALVDYRTRRGGFRSELEFRDCYLIDSALWVEMEPYIELSPVPKKLIDLNSADSLALVALPGIGPRTAHDILLYRQRLGGYYSVAQLLDLRVVTKENYALFCEEFWCDSCKIRKIDINFAPPKELAEHPYITTPRLRKILLTRETKGGWKGLEEFKKDDIFTSEEVERLAPYFQFTSVVIE